jgi:hypothetical protein
MTGSEAEKAPIRVAQSACVASRLLVSESRSALGCAIEAMYTPLISAVWSAQRLKKRLTLGRST